MSLLTPEDFPAFFSEVYGYAPFPWQIRLMKTVVSGGWPGVLDLPTGSGKTAAIDIALFHLALEATQGQQRRAPIRIAFVVDRRIVVDDAWERAKRVADKLEHAVPGSVAALVATELRTLSGDDRPLTARRLRGGVPREDDWARTPSQPTVLCSTVDQIGSRLLFRGYGLSDRMKPVHAGLIGSDCLIFLDEAHLAEPFRQTLDWIQVYRSEKWRAPESHAAPSFVSFLSATPGANRTANVSNVFRLDSDDYQNDTLARRLRASKPARLITAGRAKLTGEMTDANRKNSPDSLGQIVTEIHAALTGLSRQGITNPAIAAVLNRVASARWVFDQLRRELDSDAYDVLLLIGPARSIDRDTVVQALDGIRTGAARRFNQPLIIVATQCIEAGVDVDVDALITELAPLDALRQRFGRLNRAGRPMKPYASIILPKTREDDPIYGESLKAAREYLSEVEDIQDGVAVVDFSVTAFDARIQARAIPEKALSPLEQAPILLPAHLELLSQTSPIPAADPEVSLYLHGSQRQPDSVIVIWRADLDRGTQARRLLLLLPPRSSEAIELPVWAVRRWLGSRGRPVEGLADIAVAEPEEENERVTHSGRLVFRWKGDDDRSQWIPYNEIAPGDTVVIPGEYGGLDVFGWNPDSVMPVSDVAQRAARPFSGRRFVVRVAPGLLGDMVTEERLSETLATSASERWRDVRSAIDSLPLPQELQEDLRALDRAKGKTGVTAYLDLYGQNDGRPRGVLFVAPRGLVDGKIEENGPPNSTEDDLCGSLPGFTLTLEQHSADVESKAEDFARRAGLPPDRVADCKLSGYLHDAGKADPRFQSWLHYDDPFGPDLDQPEQILAKSDRAVPVSSRAKSGLPPAWRHEAYSVRLAIALERFSEAKDPDLVLWLVGSHHGYGRPFFPHEDPEDESTRLLPPVLHLPPKLLPGFGPQSLAFDWNGDDWTSLFERLRRRYGVWELARMEAIVRLADHRASEEAADDTRREGGKS